MDLIKYLFFLLFLCWLPDYAIGQYDHLFGKPYNERYQALSEYYLKVEKGYDFQSGWEEVRRFEAYARKHNDKEMKLEARLLVAFYRVNVYKKEVDTVAAMVRQLVADCDKRKYNHIKARALMLLGNHTWHSKEHYEMAFQTFSQLGDILKEMDDNEFPEKIFYLTSMALAYFAFQDFDEALVLFHEAIKSPPIKENSHALWRSYNTIGLYYQQNNNFDSASYYFNKALHSKVFDEDSTLWRSITKGNIGYSYYLQGEYDKAVPLFKTDIFNAIKFGDLGLAVGSLIPYADVLRMKGNYTESKAKLDSARLFIDQTSQTHRLRKYFPVLAKWHAQTGNIELSNHYWDSALIALDEYNKKFNTLQLVRAQQSIERRKQENLLLEKESKIKERNVLIVIGMVLLLSSYLLYIYQRKYFREQQKIRDLKIQNTKQELDLVSIQLAEFSQNLIQKNQTIKSLQDLFSNENQSEIREKLIQSTILTDQDWNKFKKTFEKVHKGFMKRLDQKIPGLTPSEVRYMVLAKLKMTNREMGLILGISSDSLRVTQHRLRKKLEISDADDLDHLVNSI